jgi:hypothetical protein
MPSKRKVKAGGTGVTQVFHSLAKDEDKLEEIGKSQPPKLMSGRRPLKGTGELFPTPCQTCAQRQVLCEKTEGGQPCVTCKRSKVKCSHVRQKQTRHIAKTRLIITDSDFEPTPAAEASAPKRSAAAAKVPRHIQKPLKVAPESSDEEEVVPKKKKARTQDRIPRDAEDVLGVVKGMSISHFPMSLTYLPSDYITRLNAQETDNRQFRQLFTLLGEAVGERTERMVQDGEYLNKVTLTVLDLTQERLFELSAVQHRQTELLAALHGLMTRDVGVVVLSLSDEWREMLEREARAMHEANESHFRFLDSLRSSFMDHHGIEVEIESQGEYVKEGEDLQWRVEEAQRMLKKPAIEENIAKGSADVGKTSANKATHSARSADNAKVTTTSATHAEDTSTSADDAEGETVSAEEGDTGKASADEDLSDMDVDKSDEEDPKVKRESDKPEINVPPTLQGQVIDLASTSNEASDPSLPPMARAPPMPPDPTTTTAPVTVAPLINLVSATPQTSQDAPGGTITTLHPPQPGVGLSQRRSRSRSPVPPTSRSLPMVTRSVSLGGTPGMTTEAAPQIEAARGFKRKSPHGDDIAKKKSKKAGGL